MDSLINIFGLESLFFIAFMLICWLGFNIKFNEKAVVYGPTILTTTGIFATFVGIALSLKSLNTDNIQQSIPFLLNGLKTAFWASVFGVGLALLIKFRFYVFGVKPTGDSTKKPDNKASSTDLSTEILQSLIAIRDGISGDGSNSLIYQLRTLRDDNNKKLDDLNETQKRSLEQIAKMGSEALIEALRGVIKDFNDKITEQFGENFKELNSAVAKLLDWQKQYKDYVETIIDRHDHIVASMQKASDSYELLVSKGESFSRIADNLSNTLGYLDTQTAILNKMLGDLTRLVDTASGSIPKVEQQMIEITNQLASSIEKNQESLTEGHKKTNAAILETTNLIKDSVQNTAKDMQQANEEFNKNIGEMTKKTGEQVSALNKGLEEALSKSIGGLASQLAALSEKFVKDYTPLTDRLREVVGMARKL